MPDHIQIDVNELNAQVNFYCNRFGVEVSMGQDLHWLVQKRLEEAHFLIDKKKETGIDIYLDLDFEALSHFSFAFKNDLG